MHNLWTLYEIQSTMREPYGGHYDTWTSLYKIQKAL